MTHSGKVQKKRNRRVWLRRGLVAAELLVLILLVGAAWLFYNNAKKKQSVTEFSWDDYCTMVHALGGLDDKTYLNCKEGFEYYYDKGARLFEVDLVKTADGVWVCRHDWEKSMGQWEDDGKKVLMADAFKGTALYEKYTPLTLEALFELLRKYPDAYVLIDCKEYSTRDYENTLADYKAYAEIARAGGDESVLKQLIPELYNQKMYKAAEKVYHFPSYIYSLWKEYSTKQLKKIAAYCKETGIPAVSISSEYWTEEIQEMFDEQKIKVYIYTVNDAKKAKKYLKAGAAGICTDTLLDEELKSK
ncbi:MAG: glycerophosphodiester phosphodiesterase family protein [Eubacteriales bacterium]|nr:glycerophosphodiester phosphodiesterase family protein [Eubacteriales bacterium]